MAQNSETGAFDRRHVSSGSGRSASRSPDSKAKTLGPPTPVSDETLETHPPPPRASGAVAATLLADPTGPTTPPSTPERLAALAASLPAVARESYQFGQEVAKGGIGRVVVARDQRLDRPVAIKELLVWNEKQEQRFVREALLTARLQHPAIVPIYEAGRWPDGEPFYAMKLVSGRSLADLVNERKTLPERLSLLPHVIAAAQAIAFAHSKRIIHRDLKPANVLVGELGETVVIDWGLAKDLADTQTPDEGGAPTQSGEGLTLDGAVVGTPAYMPPEQAVGKPVDERADVYALGAMLYHVLSAVPPYHDIGWEKLLSTITERPPKSIEKLAPQISDELAAIVNKAMARDPSRRYPTAKELATDLERFQTGQVVAAHTYTAKQVLVRYWKRNRTALSVTAGALSLITLVVIGTLIWTNHQRRFAEAKQREAEAASMAEAEARAAAEQSEKQATARADEMTILQAHNALKKDPVLALAWLKTLSPEYTDAGEIRRIASDAYTRGLSRTYRGHAEYINHLALSPDNKMFATASDDKTARLWNLETGANILLTGHTDEVWNVEYFPGGKEVATISKDATMRIWDTEGHPIATVKLPEPARRIVTYANGDVAGTAGNRGKPWIWHRQTNLVELPTGQDELQCSAFSPSGDTVLTIRPNGDMEIWKVGSSEKVKTTGIRSDFCMVGDGGAWMFGMGAGVTEVWNLKGTPKRIYDSAGASRYAQLSPSQKYMLVGVDNVAFVLDLTTGTEVRRYKKHDALVQALAMSPDDQFVASGSYDRTVHIWNLATGESRVLSGFEGGVTDVKFVGNQSGVVASSVNGEVRHFAPSFAGKTIAAHSSRGNALAVAPDGKVVSVDATGEVYILDSDNTPIAHHKIPARKAHDIFLSSDGLSFIVTPVALKLVADGWVPDGDVPAQPIFFGTLTNAPLKAVNTPSPVLTTVFPAGGDYVFAAGTDGMIRRISANGDIEEVLKHDHPITNLQVDSTGDRMAAGASDGKILLIDLKTKSVRTFTGHSDRVQTLLFGKDKKTLFSGGADHTLRIWNVEDGTHRSFDEGGYGVWGIRLSKDENTLYIHSVGETKIRRLSLTDHVHLPPVTTSHRGPIVQSALSADGARMVTAGLDGSIAVIDLLQGKSRLIHVVQGSVFQTRFLPGKKQILSLDSDGKLRVWPDDLPETVPELREWINKATDEKVTDR